MLDEASPQSSQPASFHMQDMHMYLATPKPPVLLHVLQYCSIAAPCTICMLEYCLWYLYQYIYNQGVHAGLTKSYKVLYSFFRL